MDIYRGIKSSKKKKRSSNVSSFEEDDVLASMLLDVPATKGSPQVAKKSTQKTTSAKKRARLEPDSPPPMAESWPDDMEDSFQEAEISKNLPVPVLRPEDVENAQNRRRVDPIFEQMATQEDTIDNDPFPEAPTLSDDLRKDVEFHKLDDGREYIHYYWFDCIEDTNKWPGVVYLFGRLPVKETDKDGKVRTRYVSSCVVVKNIKRTVYLLIKPDCKYEEVVQEFSVIMAKRYHIKEFTCEKVTKKYAFSSDSNVPQLADYVKIDYPSSQHILPSGLKGETFSHTLNSEQTPMEKVILDLKLRGPSWLRLIEPSEPVGGKLTHTRRELILSNYNNIQVEDKPEPLGTPYFCAFASSMRIYTNPNTKKNEIVAISCMVNTCMKLDECLTRTNKASQHFVLFAKPGAANKNLRLPYDITACLRTYRKTKFELFENERDLLIAFIERIERLDPDILIGHEQLSCDYETILARFKDNKVSGWHKLGRFPRSEFPQTKYAIRSCFSGRIVCDLEISAKELIHARSYDLTELASKVLNANRIEYTQETLVESYKTSDALIRLIDATWDDTDYIFSILVELNVIPLALKITNITGGVLSRTLLGGRSERNDYLLLHAFHEENYICPERQTSKTQMKGKGLNGNGAVDGELAPVRRKAAYAGGLVLEPKTGYYDNCVLLMDFNSLYPSIIQEFNICFSTVKVPEQPAGSEANGAEIIASVPEDSVETGILPAQLKKLVDGRRRVKRQLAETQVASQKIMLDIEQKALKLTANSMYGCLGFEHCRFYAKHLASLVTFKGREILMSTKGMVEKLGYEVIYGDTDSLMIDTKIVDYDEVINRGTMIKSEINKTFRLLEIDIDGVFRPLLLLKKKNYAGAIIEKRPTGEIVKKVETKGLDTVRRDRAIIAKEAGERVLSMILESDKDILDIVNEIHNYLKELGAQVASGEVSPEKFLISKQLNRNPEEYRDTKGLGHVALALRHNQKFNKKLRAGHTVEYVICLDGSQKEQASANQRAYTIAELASDPNLEIDTEYYLCQQIHPVMMRICEKLPTTNAYALAEMLGIEKCQSLHIRREDTVTNRRDQLVSKGASRYDSCPPLTILCPNCNLPDSFRERVRENKNKKKELSLSLCPQCNVRYAMYSGKVVAQIIALIRRLTIELYCSKFYCENSACDYVSQNILGPMTATNQPLCPNCKSGLSPEMDDRKMDLQLCHMRYLFDNTNLETNIQTPEEDTLDLYKECLDEVNYALKCSFINTVDAFKVFKMVCSGDRVFQQQQQQENEK